MTTAETEAPERASAVQRLGQAIAAHVHTRVVGQHDSVDLLVLALVAGGHALLEGVPGLAKTLLVRTLAQAVRLPFSRIQFTPDLMPSDITGSEMLQGEPSRGVSLRFVRGPVFANVVLADEINRTPAKTQAALLECMQEGQVTVGGEAHFLPRPFHVFATQNPLEQEGTFALPEAQLDRFLLHIQLDYPTLADELLMAAQPSAPASAPVVSAEALQQAQSVVEQIPVPPDLLREAVQLVRQTRPSCAEASAEVRRLFALGAGPRATQHLLRLCRARALLHGRLAVGPQDVSALAVPALRHRMVLSAEGFVQAGTRSAHAVVEPVLRALIKARLGAPA